jgi:hypothetical protein
MKDWMTFEAFKHLRYGMVDGRTGNFVLTSSSRRTYGYGSCGIVLHSALHIGSLECVAPELLRAMKGN